MPTDLQIISTFQPSLNQCLISNKYFSEAIPEYSHLSLPPGFNISKYDRPILQHSEMSSTLSEQLFTKLIDRLDPEATIHINEYGNKKKISKKNKNKKSNKKKSKKK